MNTVLSGFEIKNAIEGKPSGSYKEIYDSSFELPGSFGLRTSPKGKKAFFYIYKIGNKRKRLTLGYYPALSEQLARSEAKQISALVYIEGRDPKAEQSFLNKAQSFEQLFKWFLDKDLKNKTKQEYQRLYNKEVHRFIGNFKPNRIKQEDISKIIKQVAKNKERLTTANRVRSLLSRVFKFGIENGVIEQNPVKQINSLLVPQTKTELLSLEEIKIIWHRLKYQQPSIQGAFKIMLLTGQAPAKIHKLKWSEINFDSLIYTLPIALPPAAIQIIKSLRFPNGKDTYVFGEFSTKHYSTLQRTFKKILLDSKLDKNFSLFELRKSVEHQLRTLGTNQFVVAYIMQKKTEIDQLKGLKQVNLENEAKTCLERWSKILNSFDKDDGNKIIPLFR